MAILVYTLLFVQAVGVVVILARILRQTAPPEAEDEGDGGVAVETPEGPAPLGPAFGMLLPSGETRGARYIEEFIGLPEELTR